MSVKRTTAPGRLYFWGSRALYLGPDVSATVHAHYAVQVCIGLSGPVRLRTGPGSRWGNFEGALIPSNVPHETDVPAELLGTFWLDANTPDAKRLVPPSAGRPILRIDREKLGRVVAKLHACWQEHCDAKRAAEVLDEILRILAFSDEAVAVDPRVARACRLLAPDPRGDAPIEETAARVSLSASRLSHLFRAEIGLPPRRYRLWLRLRDAIRELEKGCSITEAAHAAGFADVAHLSRTFRTMLGFTPSTLLQVSRFVQAAPDASD